MCHNSRGLLRQPKWGHFRDLHIALKFCEEALFVTNNEPVYQQLGPNQEAHVYGKFKKGRLQETSGPCAAFLANMDTVRTIQVWFNGQIYELPPWSVSILPDCKNVVYNSAQVSAQTSLVQMIKLTHPQKVLGSPPQDVSDGFQESDFSWKFHEEPVGIWSNRSLVFRNLSEHLNLTKDSTDYLWYICRFEVDVADIIFLNQSGGQAVLSIEAMRDAISIFINRKFSGFAAANTAQSWVKVEKRILLQEGINEIALLSSTVGLQNYGAFMERDGAGIQGQVLVTGLASGNLNLTNKEWFYEVGLEGESSRIYSDDRSIKKTWSFLASSANLSPITWYKTYFDSPFRDGPLALDLNSMGKGEIWLNGRSLGRYWPAFFARTVGCSETCDYRGTYSSSKCLTGCGQPTQRWYHVPRSWMKTKDNLLVLFEEIGGDVSQISLMLRYQGTVCAHISEFQPTTSSWLPAVGSGSGQLFSSSVSKLEISCEEGFLVSEILFASFGNPSGQCGKFQQGECHLNASKSLVESACVGKQGCTLDITVENFGENPCQGTPKSLAVEAMCSHQLLSEKNKDNGALLHLWSDT